MKTVLYFCFQKLFSIFEMIKYFVHFTRILPFKCLITMASQIHLKICSFHLRQICCVNEMDFCQSRMTNTPPATVDISFSVASINHGKDMKLK